MILIFAAIKFIFKKALKIVRVEIFEKDTWQHLPDDDGLNKCRELGKTAANA